MNLRPYRRITSTGKFIAEIDGLRFYAIFSVFLYHLAGDILKHSQPGYGATLASNGLFQITQILNAGVPLFFAISGFILSLPFARARRMGGQPVSIKKYFLRRVTRLEPPYLLCLTLLFLAKIAAGQDAQALFPHLLASMLYMHNAVFGSPSEINYVAWSLEVEIQFYILVPALVLVFQLATGLHRKMVLGAAIILATWLSYGVVGNPRLLISIVAFAQYFLAGFLLAEFYLDGVLGRGKFVWDLLGIASAAGLLSLLVLRWQFTGWLAPWLILTFCAAAFRGVALNRLATHTWLVTIGGMCYSIYLWHNYAIAGLGRVTERIAASSSFDVRLLIQLLVMAPAVLVIGGIYFRWIERPSMRTDWPRRVSCVLTRRGSATD